MSTDPSPSRSTDAQLIEVLKQQNELLKAQNAELKNVHRSLEAQRRQSGEQSRMLEVLGRAALRDVLVEVDEALTQRQLNMMDTVQRVAQGWSMAAWAENEVRLMLQPEFEAPDQRSDPRIADRLLRLMEDHDAGDNRLMLAFPTPYVNRLWMGIWAENWHRLGPLMKYSHAPWGNTHATRAVFFERYGAAAVEAWRSVWAGKRVCVIAPRGSSYELLPELFDGARSVHRVDGPPNNAFDRFDTLTRRVREAPSADVYLCSMGSVGTVLAGHLASERGGGLHAVDVGDLPAAYKAGRKAAEGV